MCVFNLPCLSRQDRFQTMSQREEQKQSLFLREEWTSSPGESWHEIQALLSMLLQKCRSHVFWWRELELSTISIRFGNEGVKKNYKQTLDETKNTQVFILSRSHKKSVPAYLLHELKQSEKACLSRKWVLFWKFIFENISFFRHISLVNAVHKSRSSGLYLLFQSLLWWPGWERWLPAARRVQLSGQCSFTFLHLFLFLPMRNPSELLGSLRHMHGQPRTNGNRSWRSNALSLPLVAPTRHHMIPFTCSMGTGVKPNCTSLCWPFPVRSSFLLASNPVSWGHTSAK